jgi:hypothetical protein
MTPRRFGPAVRAASAAQWPTLRGWHRQRGGGRWTLVWSCSGLMRWVLPVRTSAVDVHRNVQLQPAGMELLLQHPASLSSRARSLSRSSLMGTGTLKKTVGHVGLG